MQLFKTNNIVIFHSGLKSVYIVYKNKLETKKNEKCNEKKQSITGSSKQGVKGQNRRSEGVGCPSTSRLTCEQRKDQGDWNEKRKWTKSQEGQQRRQNERWEPRTKGTGRKLYIQGMETYWTQKMAINSLKEVRVTENGWGDSKRQGGCQRSSGEPRCNRFSRTQRDGSAKEKGCDLLYAHMEAQRRRIWI